MNEKAREIYGLPIGSNRKSKINVYKNHTVEITGEEFQLLWLCFHEMRWKGAWGEWNTNNRRIADKLIRKFHKGF